VKGLVKVHVPGETNTKPVITSIEGWPEQVKDASREELNHQGMRVLEEMGKVSVGSGSIPHEVAEYSSKATKVNKHNGLI
jgi:hypothetical protein